MIVEEGTNRQKELGVDKFPQLSNYIKFLLNSNFLDEVVEYNLQLAIEKNLFILKLLPSVSNEDIKVWWKKSFVHQFLESFFNGDVLEQATQSIERWRTDDIPQSFKSTITIADVLYIYHNRRSTLLKFLSRYTKDVALWEQIISELDYYVESCEVFSLKVFQELVEKRLKEKSELLNGVLENIPVIVNKFDSNANIILSIGLGLKSFG